AESFWAEIQNAPVRTEIARTIEVTRDVAQRMNGFERRVVPAGRSGVFFHIDVHDELLYYTVVAGGQDFSADVIDYGTWPEQPTPWFTLRTAKRTLSKHYKSVSPEESIESGVHDLLKLLFDQRWENSAGQRIPIECGLVDAGYKPTEVATAIRMHGSDKVLTSAGLPIGATSKPLPEYDLKPKRSFRHGPDPVRPRWYLPTEHYINGVYRIHFDTNFWKSVTASRLVQAPNKPAAWALFGKPSGSQDHLPYVEHLMAERPREVTANGRTIDEWKQIASRDNHWLDTLVGCAVAMSLAGMQLPTRAAAPETQVIVRPKAPRVEAGQGRDRSEGGGLRDSFFVTAR
ncbi:MAG: terminase gpA endonuclease subunit, partial [Planctomycetota bacterium]